MTTTFTIFWISADRQSSIECASFDTQEAAKAALDSELANLIDIGSSDDEAALRAGTMTIDTIVENAAA